MTLAHRSSVLAACLVLALGGCGGGRKAAKRDPERDVVHKYRLAQAYLKGGNVKEALAEMERVLALDPGNAEMRSFYGQICFIAGRYPEAEAAYLRALDLDPYLTDVHNNLGALYDRTGRKSEAEEHFTRALADPAYPTPEKVYLNLGLLYGSQGRDDDAIRALRKAVEIDPKYYQAHFELAARLEATGRLEEAAREYEVAAPDYRSSGDYHYRLGFTYFRLGDKLRAADHLRRVLDVSPGSENAARADELLKLVR